MADEDIDDINTEAEEGIEEEEGLEPEEGEETEGQDEGHEGTAAEPPRTRANDRIRNLLDENRQLREKSDDFTRQLSELRRQFDERNSYQSRVSEQERLANMTYEERIQYDLQQTIERQNNFERQQAQFMRDQQDKMAFQSVVSKLPPEVQKLAPQVENELNAIRQQLGQNFPRQVVLATLLGMQAINAAMSGAVGKEKRAAQRNVQSQRTAPTRGASDVQRRDRAAKTARERLEGIVF